MAMGQIIAKHMKHEFQPLVYETGTNPTNSFLSFFTQSSIFPQYSPTVEPLYAFKQKLIKVLWNQGIQMQQTAQRIFYIAWHHCSHSVTMKETTLGRSPLGRWQREERQGPSTLDIAESLN